MFTFLSAGTCGIISEATYRGAALIELLHTASLVHDDVVDDSNYRRNFFSINALWKNKVAVLVGDYLYTQGLLLSLEHNDFHLLRLIGQAAKEMTEGELLQMEKARALDITEEVYLEVIRQKTATLIASCCAVGAASVGASEDYIQLMHKFGEKIGIAFQIKDDLFDYGKDEIGKPLGIDIKEKKMTLPLIYALRRATPSDKRRILNIVKNESENSKKVTEVIQYVTESGGLEYTTEVMHRYYQEALQLLEQFPASTYKKSLADLVTFSIERKK
jgi:octaprenyl-diphosphate synthase